VVLGGPAPRLLAGARLSLDWPPWYPPTTADQLAEAQTLSTLAAAGQISRETAVRTIADSYGVHDVPAELARIAKEHSPDDHDSA
jgi:hypothetical protein